MYTVNAHRGNLAASNRGFTNDIQSSMHLARAGSADRTVGMSEQAERREDLPDEAGAN